MASKTSTVEKESGTALLDSFYTLVGREVDGEFSKQPNPSGTYTRLLVNGSAFAYVFPPAPSSLAVKIPKQLLGVEGDLPSGHGFKRTKWGLTRTVKHASELPTVAKAFAVAAAAAKQKPAAAPAPAPEAQGDPESPAATPNAVVVRDGRVAKSDPKPSDRRTRAKRAEKSGAAA